MFLKTENRIELDSQFLMISSDFSLRRPFSEWRSSIVPCMLSFLNKKNLRVMRRLAISWFGDKPTPRLRSENNCDVGDGSCDASCSWHHNTCTPTIVTGK
jgi:hypothetical protein